MGHIQFLNQDGEWESFPTPEQEENLRANALVLEELGYKLICQSCNRYPSIKQIRERHLYLCKQYYSAYPDILRTLSANSEATHLTSITVITLSDSNGKNRTFIEIDEEVALAFKTSDNINRILKAIAKSLPPNAAAVL